MIYLIATIQLVPDKTQEFCKILNEYRPAAERHGQKLIASFVTTIGTMEEVTDIWAFESLSHFAKVRESQFKDPEWQALNSKFWAIATGETLKLVTPLPCSPMK